MNIFSKFFASLTARAAKATDFSPKQIIVDPTDIEYAPYHLTNAAKKQLVFIPVPPRSTAYPPLENGQRPALSSVYQNVLKENFYAPRMGNAATAAAVVAEQAQAQAADDTNSNEQQVAA